MRYANIVHLSDLHLKSSGVDSLNQGRLLGGLEEELRQLSETHLKPDLIVFSGDLSHAGDAESLSSCRTKLYRILEAASLPPSNLIVAPGNHDALRSVVERDAGILESFRDRARAVDGINALAIESQFIRHVDEKFRPFARFSKTFGPPPIDENVFAKLFAFDELKISIIAINTSTLTASGSKMLARDDGELAFPDLVIDNLLGGVPPSHSLIIVGHHPLSMMSADVGASLKTLLCKRAAAYLFGHMHNSAPETIESAAGECKFLQSGALYMGRDRWNGYHVISALNDDSCFRVTTRKWHEGRLEFGVSSDLSDTGVLYLPSSGAPVWDEVVDRPNYRLLDGWRKSELIPVLADECGRTLTDQNLDDVYVDPEFERDIYIDTEGLSQRLNQPETIKFPAVRDSSTNFLISAQPESGKTALARHWSQELARRSSFEPGWTVPIILNYPNLKNYTGGIEAAVVRRFPNLPDGLRARNLLSAGLATIFVDDMRLEETREKAALCEFMDKYPACRYIILTSSHFLQMSGVSPVISDKVQFEVIRVKKLQKRQLLDLIEKHGTKDPVQADRLLDRLLNEANALNVPLTPVSSTFFIQILTERSSKPVINRAGLIERYVEISLEKFALEEILTSSFDFHNKADLLSDIAESMCRSEEYCWTEKETLTCIESYLEKYDLNFSAIRILEYFLSARILERVDLGIQFRLTAFLEYFAARRMQEDRKFRDWVLDDIRYLQFQGEIASYAAMNRRDEGLIDEIVQRYTDVGAEVWAELPEDVRDASILESIVLPTGDASEDEVFAIERKIFAKEFTETGRKELLNSSTSPELSDGRTVNRPSVTDPSEKWMRQLEMLSSLAKHLEIVPKEKKSALLDIAIKGWLSVLAQSIGLVPALAKERSVTLNGIKYEIHFPDGMSLGDITRRIMLGMPTAVFKLVHQFMGSDKLEIPLSRGIGTGDGAASAREQFFRVGLLSLLGVDGIADKVEIVRGEIRGHSYLSEALLRQLYELSIRYRFDEGELAKIRNTAGSMAAELEGVPSSKVTHRRDEVVRSLAKSRLIVEMRPAIADKSQMK